MYVSINGPSSSPVGGGNALIVCLPTAIKRQKKKKARGSHCPLPTDPAHHDELCLLAQRVNRKYYLCPPQFSSGKGCGINDNSNPYGVPTT